MKNLFKNLMLVAVAAMAFAACSQDVNEVNKVEKKTVISGVLNIENDDTRSGFTGSYKEGDKTFYQSSWDGGESIKIYIDGYGSVFTTVDEEGRFEVAVNGEISSGTSMYVCSPADAWDSQWTPTIPTEQTPRANSVDPAVHILQSVGATVSSTSIEMSLQKACYGKMTVNVPENFEIKKVEVSFNGGTVYTLNATNVENNVFWFAVDSMIDVTTFTVTAYDEDNAITKTVDVAAAGKTLKFQWGHVSTFSVSDLKAVEPEPVVPVFTSAYADDYGNGCDDYYLIFENAILGKLILNAYGMTNEDWSIPANVYGFTTNSNGYFYPGMYSTYNDIYLNGGSVEIAIVDGQYVFTFSNLTDDNGNIVLESATYTGIPTGLVVPDAGGEEPEPEVSASAALVTDTTFGGFNPYDVTFSFENDDQVVVRFNTGGAQYLHLGAWQTDNWQDPHYISQVKYNGAIAQVTACNVAYENDAYTVTMSVFEYTNYNTLEYTYTGAIKGLIAPEACDCLKEPEQPEQPEPDPDQPETGVADGTSIAKAYTFTSYSTYEDFGYPVMCLSGAENGATFNFESNSQNGFPTGMHKFNDGAWYSALCEYKINGVAQTVDFVNSVIWVEGDNVNGYTVEYIYIVTEGGNGIYYKYDGKFFK